MLLTLIAAVIPITLWRLKVAGKSERNKLGLHRQNIAMVMCNYKTGKKKDTVDIICLERLMNLSSVS